LGCPTIGDGGGVGKEEDDVEDKLNKEGKEGVRGND
jgi:hypothetical protein